MKKLFKVLSVFALMFVAMGQLFTAVHAEEEVTISFMIPEWGAPTEEMIKEFEAEHNFKVEVIPTDWDNIRDRIATAAVGQAVAADVFEVDWAWVGEFVSAEWLAPLEVDPADIEDMPTYQTFKVGDDYYAAPYANDFRIAYYNKKMHEEAGITEAPKTWDEAKENFIKIKEEGIVEYPFLYPVGAEENATTSLMWLAYTRNGILFNDDNSINEESILDALTFIDEMNKLELMDPALRSASGRESYLGITNGDGAFVVGPSSYVARINDPEQSSVVGDVEAILIPGKEDVATSTLPYPEAIGISAYTEHPEEAKIFVDWYTSPETQKRLFEELSVMPTRNSILNELIENDEIKNSGAMKELAGMIQSQFPNGVPEYYTEMSTAIFNAVNQMANGSITPEEATEEIVKTVDSLR